MPPTAHSPRRTAHIGLALTVTAVLLAGCGRSAAPEPVASPEPAQAVAATTAATPVTASVTATPAAPEPRRASRRREVRIALGEWAVAPDARAVRPGPVTLVITNRGKLPHGLELKAESGEGRSGGERFELESKVLRPGETVRMRVTLPAGVYEIECFVGDHDDRGMEGLWQVRRDAPQRAASPARPKGTGTGTAVRIEGFAFAPRTLTVSANQTVTWRNADAAQHNVVQMPTGFASPGMSQGARYARRFAQPGQYEYVCSLHPGMKGVVKVQG
ncbi:MAG: hypothetical protein QOD55_755 [Solirubrobacteraceae bacterium]|jgi:plastocyanin|nr:hypothetical protein [Solirubrobacteraceae bacterium]